MVDRSVRDSQVGQRRSHESSDLATSSGGDRDAGVRTGRRWLASVLPASFAAAIAGTAAALVVGRLMGPGDPYARGTNDYLAHVERAQAISLHPWFMSVPHPGWHLLYRAASVLWSTPVAVTVLASLASAAMALVLWTVARSCWDDLLKLRVLPAFAFALSYLLLENPGVLVPRGSGALLRLEVLGRRARGPAFFPLHTWGSPTMNLSLPLVVVMFLLVVDVVRGDRSVLRPRGWMLAVVTVATTMVLPAATLALVPAALLVGVVTTGRRLTVPRLLEFFVAPGITVVVSQAWFLRSDVSVFENTSWRWHPFWPVRYFGMDRWSFWLLAVLFVAAGVLLGRSYLRDVGVRVSLAAVLVAFPPGLLLQQTHPDKVLDGDLIMPLFFSVVLLTLVTVRLLLLELQRRWDRRSVPDRRLGVVFVSVVLVAMLVAGVVDLGAAIGSWPET